MKTRALAFDTSLFFFNYDTENTNYENLTQNLSFNNEHMTYLSRENNTLDISELF